MDDSFAGGPIDSADKKRREIDLEHVESNFSDDDVPSRPKRSSTSRDYSSSLQNRHEADYEGICTDKTKK